ncbi:MAG: TIGR03905 family TSCPD domain-containing protein [Bacilli bacterium]|nr:TIGR03905 family TSCPD domain-containing protein [Bacilli bacterium]
MKHIDYQTAGVCARLISFDLKDDNTITNLVFTGGCNGNLKAISKLLEGTKAEDAIRILKGNTCGPRSTSCADQLSKALAEAIEQN